MKSAMQATEAVDSGQRRSSAGEATISSIVGMCWSSATSG